MSDDRDILNCGASGVVRFEFRCSQRWSEMEPTGDERKRFCLQCERHVFWCHTVAEAGLRAYQGECIAIPSWLAERVVDDRAMRDTQPGIGMPEKPGQALQRLTEDS